MQKVSGSHLILLLDFLKKTDLNAQMLNYLLRLVSARVGTIIHRRTGIKKAVRQQINTGKSLTCK